jgi:hypothetical protein
MVFQSDQNIAEVKTLTNLYLAPITNNLATDSKLSPTLNLSTSDTTYYKSLATQHSKNKWLTVSFSQQNRHERPSRCFLLAKFSRVKTLLLANSQRKHMYPSGDFNFPNHMCKNLPHTSSFTTT